MFPITSDSFQHGTKMAMRRCAGVPSVRSPDFPCRMRCARQMSTGIKSSIPLINNATASVPSSHGQSEEKTKDATICERLIPFKKVVLTFRESQKSVDFSTIQATLVLVKRSYSEWLSFSQLIQELIGGVVRRHIFSQWELDLLLDLQLSAMSKTERSVLLRRYLKFVLQEQAAGALEPPRLGSFLAAQNEARLAAAKAA